MTYEIRGTKVEHFDQFAWGLLNETLSTVVTSFCSVAKS